MHYWYGFPSEVLAFLLVSEGHYRQLDGQLKPEKKDTVPWDKR